MELVTAGDKRSGFGGKGESLLRLTTLGYRCPIFDLIDAGCWADLLSDPRSRRRLSSIAHSRDALTVSLACHEIRQSIAERQLPDVVRAWFDANPIGRLGGVVVVRSSALSEDGATASSAGQYESTLGICDPSALEEGIRCVLSSYFGDRAVLYRRSRGLRDESELSMGLVIQTLVPAVASGIAFSRNPVTQHDEVVVEASWGLGTLIVSGTVEPDRFHIPRSGDKDSTVHVGRKGRALRFDPSAGELVEQVEPRAGVCLAPETLAELAHGVRSLERDYGEPVDVEWAVEPDGSLVYLQARPITSHEPGDVSVGALAEAF